MTYIRVTRMSKITQSRSWSLPSSFRQRREIIIIFQMIQLFRQPAISLSRLYMQPGYLNVENIHVCARLCVSCNPKKIIYLIPILTKPVGWPRPLGSRSWRICIGASRPWRAPQPQTLPQGTNLRNLIRWRLMHWSICISIRFSPWGIRNIEIWRGHIRSPMCFRKPSNSPRKDQLGRCRATAIITRGLHRRCLQPSPPHRCPGSVMVLQKVIFTQQSGSNKALSVCDPWPQAKWVNEIFPPYHCLAWLQANGLIYSKSF